MRNDAKTPTGCTNPLIRMRPATGLLLFLFDRAPTQWGGPATRDGYPRYPSNQVERWRGPTARPTGMCDDSPSIRSAILQSAPPGHTLPISDRSLHPVTHDAYLRCCSPPLLPHSRPSSLHATPPRGGESPPSDHLLLVAGEARARFIWHRGSIKQIRRGATGEARQSTV
jgi:hypothetical protein